QRLVNARMLGSSEKTAGERRQALVEKLPAESRKRLAELEASCQHALEIHGQNEDPAAETNRDAFARLQRGYLKLLVARHNLAAVSTREPEAELAKRVSDLEREVRDSKSESLRQSKAATLEILRERLANVRRSQQSLEEIDSDLTRIEAQVQL